MEICVSLKRKTEMDRIREILSYVKSEVELSNPSNLTDINIYAENFYRDLLNLIFGYNLQNINIIEPNSAAIDLGDENEKFSIQVTSTSNLDKARKTVKKFNDRDYHKKYDKLIILNISTKTKHKKQLIGDEDKHQLDTSEDIWDFSDILEHIGDKNLEKLSEVKDFLEKQVKLSQKNTVSKEVSTFQALIGLLSDEAHSAAGKGYINKPDPKGKIEERFSQHTEFLKAQFKDLYTEFGEILKDVREHSDLGHVKLRRLSLHLRNLSDGILVQCNGDAKQALENLVSKLEKQLSEGNVEYDISAIRFFVIDELIRCNVFPNKEAINA